MIFKDIVKFFHIKYRIRIIFSINSFSSTNSLKALGKTMKHITINYISSYRYDKIFLLLSLDVLSVKLSFNLINSPNNSLDHKTNSL